MIPKLRRKGGSFLVISLLLFMNFKIYRPLLLTFAGCGCGYRSAIQLSIEINSDSVGSRRTGRQAGSLQRLQIKGVSNDDGAKKDGGRRDWVQVEEPAPVTLSSPGFPPSSDRPTL